MRRCRQRLGPAAGHGNRPRVGELKSFQREAKALYPEVWRLDSRFFEYTAALRRDRMIILFQAQRTASLIIGM